MRSELEAHGSIFRSTSDTEVVLHLIAQSQSASLVDCVIEALRQVQGAYSLLVIGRHEMLAVRDPHGFRPRCLGQLENGGYVVASETCARDLIEATYLREVLPGELMRFSADGVQSYFPFAPAPSRNCVFELVYFARTDSDVFGHNVYMMRKAFGAQLAREAPIDADVVIPVPDGGIPAALGYAEAAGIPFDTGLTRNHYVGRTFIEPQQSIRNFGVKIKLNANRSCLQGKRVVVVDDSIVRGTTSKKLVQTIRHAGAKEVHFRISSPPTTHSCVYGIDTPTSGELIASSHSIDEICDYLQADSLAYLSHEGMMLVAHADQQGYCSACFTGNYPISIPQQENTVQLPLFG
jgi:amidophosphoribosyltransferase